MAGRIRDEDIAAVRERARIDEIVSQYVTLRPSGGGSLKGLCPFHDEKTPSFNVRPQVNLFHCFGCGEGGDVISFLQKHEHLSFTEAVERLADKVGVQLRYEETGSGRAGPRQNREERTRLIEAHRLATEFYAEQLTTSPEAATGRQFLDERGFDREAAEKFGVGYAPKGGEVLRKHLLQKGFTDHELVTAGLVAQGRSTPYDRFRGRLLWPIHDLLGDVVGFGARRLFDDDRIEAKYLNTPETTIYKKSHLLYGVHFAKRDIARSSQAVVVEGYTDVMACHLAGVPTAVATCGTAFGEDHVRILRRLLRDQDEYRGRVIFTFDGDEAGKKAAIRAFEGDQRFVGQTYVAIEPNGLDPCDLRQQSGDASVRELIARHRPLFEFAIRTMVDEFDLDHAEGRTQALEKAVPQVARIRDRALRDEYARRLAGWVGAPDELSVVRRVRAAAGAPDKPARRPSVAQEPRQAQQMIGVPDHGSADPQSIALEREVLRVAVQRPALAGPAFDAIEPEAFLSPVFRSIRQTLAAAGGCATQGGGAAWMEALLSNAPDDVTRHVLSELAVEAIPTDEAGVPRYVESVVLRLTEIWVSRRLVSLKARLQRTDPSSEVQLYNKLFGELMTLEAHRRDLRDRGVGGA
ncbi:DNA primase [Phytoactinopolyspora mesophila]|uniref:DNA primase n=1 Tax=Phytoactinopolyspora mesophila TaxID=2650750 RepID=A0A7K3M0I6_9ACTN|nr:DNA primase [Phytoactinopolyspora mesophila]